MEACSRISMIDKMHIIFLLQRNSSFLFYLNPVPWPLNPFHRCRIEILPQPPMSSTVETVILYDSLDTL